jgi:very-short-patch-repair endonuclease
MIGKWAKLALTQAGAISAAQLAEGGVSPYARRQLVAGGVLLRARRGVYLMAGAEGGWKQDLWTGLLAAGPSSFACRRSAAQLWDLDGVEPGAVDIGVGTGHAPRRSGTARLGGLRPVDLTVLDGIPVTSVPRTLVDLAATASPVIVERSFECALRRKLVTTAFLQHPGLPRHSRAGRVLSDILAGRPPDAPPTDSDAETLFVQIARAVGLPAPQRQFRILIGGRAYRIDFAWPALRLAVEIDGASVHGPRQLGSDLRRQNHIVLDGWMILRFTWFMVAMEPDGVGRVLTRAWTARSIVVTAI